MHRIDESQHYTPQLNITLYVKYTEIKIKKKNRCQKEGHIPNMGIREKELGNFSKGIGQNIYRVSSHDAKCLQGCLTSHSCSVETLSGGRGFPNMEGRGWLAADIVEGEMSPSSTDGPRALVLVKRQRELAEVGTKYAMKMPFSEGEKQDIVFSNSFSLLARKMVHKCHKVEHMKKKPPKLQSILVGAKANYYNFNNFIITCLSPAKLCLFPLILSSLPWFLCCSSVILSSL